MKTISKGSWSTNLPIAIAGRPANSGRLGSCMTIGNEKRSVGGDRDDVDACRRRAIEEIRFVLEELEMPLPRPGVQLLGWWELPDHETWSDARLLPFFEGDDGLHEGLTTLAVAIEGERHVGQVTSHPRNGCDTERLRGSASMRSGAGRHLATNDSAKIARSKLPGRLLMVGFEDAAPGRRQAAERMLLRQLSTLERRANNSYVSKVMKLLSANPDLELLDLLETNAQLANGPEWDELWRLWCATQFVLGPRWARNWVVEFGKRMGNMTVRRVFKAMLAGADDAITSGELA